MESIDRVTRRLKLQNLRVLDAVVRSGSMARAAGELHISQPAISKAIGELEHTVGVRLLDRGRYGVEPTAYGRALLRRSVTVFDELRESVKEIEYLSDPTAGELRIGALEAVAAGLLAATIERLSRKHPRIIFHVTTALSHNTLYTHDLRERKLDLAIGRLTSIAEDEFKTEVLFNEQLYVVAGPTSPWARRRRVRLAELVNEPWILAPENPNILGSLIAEAFHASGLEVPRATVLTLSLHHTQWFARERPLPHNSPGQHASFRRQLFAAQGAADRIADQTTAGWDRHPEESDAESGGAALPRLRTRGRQAFGRRKISAARSVSFGKCS